MLNLYKYFFLTLWLPFHLFSADLSSKLTIITTCSPCCSYPRTIFLQLSQYSLYKFFPDFDTIPKIIVCDGVRNPSDRANYEAYKENLKTLVARHPHFKNTQLIFCEEWVCLVGALKEAFKQVKTDYVFIHQDDFEICLPIDLHGLIDAMDKNHSIKHVRLNSGVNNIKLSNSCDRYLDEYIEGGSDFPLLRTVGWSDNDHFARKDYYENFIFPLIGDEKTFMEAKLMTAAAQAFNADPIDHIKLYGSYLYGHFNEGPYINHLDRKSCAW